MKRPAAIVALAAVALAGAACSSRAERAETPADPAAAAPAATTQVAAAPAAPAELPTMTVYKSPTCGCCKGWIEHVKAAGFTVEVHDPRPQRSPSLA